MQHYANRPNRIIISSDRIINDLRISIGVDDRHRRNAQASRLTHGILFASCIDHDHRVRQCRHLKNSIKIAAKFCRLAVECSQLLFPHLFVIGGLLDLLNELQAADALADRRQVGERPAQPALINIKLSTGHGCFLDRFLRLLLAADK